ncbi:MAG: cytochrome c biogenesis CcdA family protein [Actinomycetota bacterium]
MRDIILGTTILAGFIGGVVALFAPCCISVMLPAYFATSFQRRRALLPMTFVFALGVAAVILPIAFGASFLSRLIVGQHTLVFLIGAALLLMLGVATLAGWKPALPMLGMRARSERGPGAVFALGAFSGIASACCAPVLAGVVALSGAAASFGAALAVGVAYVFGMVLPLLAISLVWDRRDWGNSRLLRGRDFTVTAFGRSRQVHSTALASGALLIVMGVIVAVLAFTGTAMPNDGWQVELSARLQHYASVVLSSADAVPGWVAALVIFAALGLLVRKAVIDYLDNSAPPEEPDGGHQPDPSAPDRAVATLGQGDPR